MIAALPWKLIGAAVAALALIGVVWAHFASDARLQRKYDATIAQAGKVVIALQDASGNKRADWSTAPGQIVALGESRKALKLAVEMQTQAVDEWAAEAAQRKAEAAEWKRIADRAEAQRRSALKRLSDMAVTPGTRDDCMQLINEADEALDLARSAGI